MKPSMPQGTRDFVATTLLKRRYIIDTIRSVFELFGFEPLETPALENLDTLMGKYGEEGDNLIFKILNNGLDHPSKTEMARESFEQVLQGKNQKNITERALRYDLTIPFARFMAMNYHQLPLPFKRYQIQPVWRADRPQKGRYREFYQCDADIAGSHSLIADAEFVEIYATVFDELKVPVEIKINNRKILSGLAEACGVPDRVTDITVAIDKLDKIGAEKVSAELRAKGFTQEQIELIEEYIGITGEREKKLLQLEQLLGASQTARQGIDELRELFSYATNRQNVVLDPTLARGLDYYTGTIYEVKARDVKMGSIGGGGRYDNLLGLFGIEQVPGSGISFGLDRIYDVMEELTLFPAQLGTLTQVLFFNLGQDEGRHAFELLHTCRRQGVRAEFFYESVKLDKQFKYATRKGIPYVVIIGTQEIQKQTCVVKELASGDQWEIGETELAEFFLERERRT